MRNERGLTLLEVIVIICGIIMLIAVVLPRLRIKGIQSTNERQLQRVHERVVCGRNLQGLGVALAMYANDYDDAYVLQSGAGKPLWSTSTDGFDDPDKDWKEAERVTVGASLYLLVREVDVSPVKFLCPAGGQSWYDGANPDGLDITELWDFGMYSRTRIGKGIGYNHGPRSHVSFSYQMPYGFDGGKGEFAADGTKSAAFAVMADKNPWFDPKLETGKTDSDNWTDFVGPMGEYYLGALEKWEVQRANSYPHSREGQNVLFGDGHASYEKTSDVGVKHDNIYTRRGEGNGEDAIRIGDADEMGEYGVDNVWQPRNALDSFLVNDDSRGEPYD